MGNLDNSKNSKIGSTIYNYLFEDMKKNGYKLLFVYLTVISALELLAYSLQGIFSIISSRIWLLGGLFCLIIILYYFAAAFISDIRKKEYLPVLAVSLLVIYLLLIIGNINCTEINPDAAQQAAAGMNSFHQSDLCYTGKAFLGYPNRQYIITAIPAFLFGRSIESLQAGFALPFITGMLIFYCGLRKWALRKNISEAFFALPVYALFIFPFVTEYYINFEQAIYPISYTMAAIGFLLMLLCTPNLACFIGLAWNGCMLSNSYTPSLASLGLLIVLLAFSTLLWSMKPERMPFKVASPGLAAKACLLVNINIITFLLATFLNKRQDRITQVRTDTDIIRTALTSIYDFLTDKNARFFGAFGLIVIIYLLAALTMRLKIRDLLLSLWILGVFAASNLLKGYTAYQPAWIMQRALIIIPVVITGISLTVFDIVKRYQIEIRRSVAVILIIGFSFIGLNNFSRINQSFIYFNHIQPMKYMLNDLEKTVKEEKGDSPSEFNLVLYTDNILMQNPADYCKFFFPNAKVYTPEYGQLPQDLDLSLKTYIYSDREYDAEGAVRSFAVLKQADRRYHLTINWYKGSIRK